VPIVNIDCPKCRQTFRSSDEVKDTRIKCPLCGVAFVVKKFASDDETPKVHEEPEGPNNPTQQTKPEVEEEDANPYGVKTVTLAARCPNCANEMVNATAIVCVYCGYNTQTRSLGKTKRVVQQTGVDTFKWLMPGFLCVAGVFVLVLLQVVYVVYLGPSYRIEEGVLWGLLFNEPVYLWLTMILVGVIWGIGRFAFKRLILEPTPPENVID
jgi:DNA-directed RNA polymerase subunit RPC12/RpoP